MQVNGKLKGRITLSADATQEEAMEILQANSPEILDGKTIVKVIYVKGRILNIVAK